MKLYAIYNKLREHNGFMTDFNNYKLINNEQWVGEDVSLTILPQILQYVNEEQLPYIFSKLGTDIRNCLSYDDGFMFSEEAFLQSLNDNSGVIELRKKIYQSYLNETFHLIQEQMEFGIEVSTEIQEKRREAYDYLKAHV